MHCLTRRKTADTTAVSNQIMRKGTVNFLNATKFLEWTSHSLKAETNTHRGTSSLISRLRSGFYNHWEERKADADAKCLQAESAGTLLAVLYCALAVTYRSSLGASRDLARGLLCAWITEVYVSFCTTNMPLCQMESALVQAFMGANWWRIGQRSTLTALTFFSPLLTY